MSATITGVTGNVKIKDLNQTSKPVLVRVGTIVKNGQLLIIGKRSSVKFTCANGTLGSKTTPGSYGLDDICPIRTPNDGSSPDDTKLLE